MIRTVQCPVDEFCEQIDLWVQKAILSGAGQFDALLRRLPGVYPVDVVQSVRRQSSAGVISRPVVSRLLAGSNYPFAKAARRGDLPAPHPLDYDWRFTPATRTFLLRELETAARPSDALVCLGAPSVFQEALRRGAARRAVLIDANPAVIRHFLRLGNRIRVWQCDVFRDPIPEVRSSAIMVDPPWYPEQMRLFLWVASQICAVGGHVLVSLPPRGTRPGVAAEIDEIMNSVGDLGFEVERVVYGALRYDSPQFERNALSAVGIRLAAYDWRCGDLCTLRLHCRRRTARPRLRCLPDNNWLDESLFGMRLRLRKQPAAEFLDPTLESLVQGDVLPSVSRRHRLRKSVDVWTGGNRVFACSGTMVLRSIVRAVARGQDPVQRIASVLDRSLQRWERQLILLATRQLMDLARQERNGSWIAGEG